MIQGDFGISYRLCSLVNDGGSINDGSDQIREIGNTFV